MSDILKPILDRTYKSNLPQASTSPLVRSIAKLPIDNREDLAPLRNNRNYQGPNFKMATSSTVDNSQSIPRLTMDDMANLSQRNKSIKLSKDQSRLPQILSMQNSTIGKFFNNASTSDAIEFKRSIISEIETDNSTNDNGFSIPGTVKN
jgi:hypothetical protein